MDRVQNSAQEKCTKIKQSFKRFLSPDDHSVDPPLPAPSHTTPPEHWMGYLLCSSCSAYIYPSYSRGPHPFGHLICPNPSCNTPISSSAQSSAAFRRHDVSKKHQAFIEVDRLSGPHSEQVPYFTVCPCGLTHRARLYKPNLLMEWKDFPRTTRDEPTLKKLGRFVYQKAVSKKEKLRRFVKQNVHSRKDGPQKDGPQKDGMRKTRIEHGHLQCGSCHRKYDAVWWQHFVVMHDGVFHIDGADEFGRWTELRWEE